MTRLAVKSSGPDPKKHKKVVISEIEKLASKPSISSQLPAVPLKSALKKKVMPKQVESKQVKEAEESEGKSSRGPASENDVVKLIGSGEDESDDDSSDQNDDSCDDDSNRSSDDDSEAPLSSTDQPTPNRKSKQKKAQEETGVVYLGRVPEGFYESEMRAYFSQFGQVLRLRLSRCPKTGKPRHYAFIEFKHVEVAQIVAETIHNYLLCGKLLQCHVLDKDQAHPKLWVGTGKIFTKRRKPRLDREKRNQPKTTSQQTVISKRLIGREELKRKRLAALGIDYDFPGYTTCASGQPQDQTNPTPGKKSKKSKQKV